MHCGKVLVRRTLFASRWVVRTPRRSGTIRRHLYVVTNLRCPLPLCSEAEARGRAWLWHSHHLLAVFSSGQSYDPQKIKNICRINQGQSRMLCLQLPRITSPPFLRFAVHVGGRRDESFSQIGIFARRAIPSMGKCGQEILSV